MTRWTALAALLGLFFAALPAIAQESGPVAVNSVLELEADDLADTAGVLAPFASLEEGSTIVIDLGARDLEVGPQGAILVPSSRQFAFPGPPAFGPEEGQGRGLESRSADSMRWGGGWGDDDDDDHHHGHSGDRGSPHLWIKSSGSLIVRAPSSEPDRAARNGGGHGGGDHHGDDDDDHDDDDDDNGPNLPRGRGAIETSARNGRAGDIFLDFGGSAVILGSVRSLQEKDPNNSVSTAGAITIRSAGGDVIVGAGGLVANWGEKPGTGPISLVSCGGDVAVQGLVLNRKGLFAHHPPVINVASFAGDVHIDGGALALNDFQPAGPKMDLTGGLMTFAKGKEAAGRIDIEALGDVFISRDTTGVWLNRESRAAVANVHHENEGDSGGAIRVRALEGSISARDRALEAVGKKNNSAALVELFAEDDVELLAPEAPWGQRSPTIDVDHEQNSHQARGGTCQLRSRSGSVIVEAGAKVEAERTVAKVGPGGTVQILPGAVVAGLQTQVEQAPAVEGLFGGCGDFGDLPSAPLISFDPIAYGAGEAAGRATLTVALSAASAATVTVQYATQEGTALANQDYLSAAGVLTFQPGQTTASLEALLLDDNINEVEESFQILLSNPINGTLNAAAASAQITIQNRLVFPTVAFESVQIEVVETLGNSAAAATVALSGPAAFVPGSIDYFTQAETAAEGQDYLAAAGTLTFEPGQTVAMLEIAILDDQINETSESFKIILSNPINLELNPEAGSARIVIDNRLILPRVSFAESEIEAAEAEGGSSAALVVTLSEPAGPQGASVQYATQDESATQGEDYLAAAGTLIFEPGQAVAALAIPILDDVINEPSESFLVALFNSIGAELGETPARISIDNRVILPTVGFTRRELRIAERPDGGARIAFEVALSGPEALTPVQVDYISSDISARAGEDYLPVSDTLIFEPGIRSLEIETRIAGDWLNEPEESFKVELRNPLGAEAGNSTATVFIENLFAQPWVAFEPSFIEVAESETESYAVAFATVALSGPEAGRERVEVSYQTVDGSAEAFVDYEPVSGTLIFEPSQTIAQIEVLIWQDFQGEIDEYFQIVLSDPAGAYPGAMVLTIAIPATTAYLERTIPAKDAEAVSRRQAPTFIFSDPLEPNSTTSAFSLEADGQPIAFAPVVSQTLKRVSLVPASPLPPMARISATVDGTILRDASGSQVDADADGSAGGLGLLEFDTVSDQAAANASVQGRVFAAEVVAGTDGTRFRTPLRGVRVYAEGFSEQATAVTDAMGNFSLPALPAGRARLVFDGLNAIPAAGGHFSAVIAELETRPDQASLFQSVPLPFVEEAGWVAVSAEETVLVSCGPALLQKFPQLEGTLVEVAPDASMAAQGVRVGLAPLSTENVFSSPFAPFGIRSNPGVFLVAEKASATTGRFHTSATPPQLDSADRTYPYFFDEDGNIVTLGRNLNNFCNSYDEETPLFGNCGETVFGVHDDPEINETLTAGWSEVYIVDENGLPVKDEFGNFVLDYVATHNAFPYYNRACEFPVGWDFNPSSQARKGLLNQGVQLDYTQEIGVECVFPGAGTVQVFFVGFNSAAWRAANPPPPNIAPCDSEVLTHVAYVGGVSELDAFLPLGGSGRAIGGPAGEVTWVVTGGDPETGSGEEDSDGTVYLTEFAETGEHNVTVQIEQDNGDGCIVHDSILVFNVDLLADTNNDGVLDKATDDPEDNPLFESSQPGMIVLLNDDDDNEDGLPDNRDFIVNDSINAHELDSDDLFSAHVETFFDEDFAGYLGTIELLKTGNINSINIFRKDEVGEYVLIEFDETAKTSLSLSSLINGNSMQLFIEGVTVGEIMLELTHRYIDNDTSSGIPQEYSHTDRIAVTVLPILVDLDLDSDNDNGFDSPEQDDEEDEIENLSSEPGKFLLASAIDFDGNSFVDSGEDFDADSLLDYKDMQIGASPSTQEPAHFVPLVLSLPFSSVNGETLRIDPNQAEVTFSYQSSDPLFSNSLELFPAEPGLIRIWTEDAGVERRPQAFQSAPPAPGGRDNVGGHYIAPNSVFDLKDLPPSEDGKWKFFVESLTVGESTISVFVREKENSSTNQRENDNLRLYGTDIVKIDSINIDLIIDSNNNFIVGDIYDFQNEINEAIDFNPNEIMNDNLNENIGYGRILKVNNDNDDRDDVLDFYDGYNLNDNIINDDLCLLEDDLQVFMLNLSSHLLQRLDNIQLKFIYNTIDINNNIEDFNSFENGYIRIWEAKTIIRTFNKNKIEDGGNLLSPMFMYNLNDFTFNSNDNNDDIYSFFFIEALTTSKIIGNDKIIIELYYDNKKILTDEISFTSVKLNATFTEQEREGLTDLSPNYPVNFVRINDDDDDEDGVPDWFDGYNFGQELFEIDEEVDELESVFQTDKDDSNINENDLNIIKIEFEEFNGVFLTENFKIRFRYDQSNPISHRIDENINISVPEVGNIRLWTNTSLYDLSTVQQEGFDRDPSEYPYGSFLPSYSANVSTPTLPNLETTYEWYLNIIDDNKIFLYLEGIEPNLNNSYGSIVIEIDPDGEGRLGFVIQQRLDFKSFHRPRIVNYINPSAKRFEKIGAGDFLPTRYPDSDDILLIGNMKDDAFDGSIPELDEAARIWYNIPENENDFNTNYAMTIQSLRFNEEIDKQISFNDLYNGQYNYQSWNGRFENNEYLANKHYKVILTNNTNWNNLFFKDEYIIYDISCIYVPNIYLSPEDSPPIDAEWALDKAEVWEIIHGPGGSQIDRFIAHPPGNIDSLLNLNNTENVVNYYLEFINEEDRRDPMNSEFPPDKTVHVRNTVEIIRDDDGKICDYIFYAQYWLFYSFSSLPTYNTISANYHPVQFSSTCHGMDWEFLMIVVKASNDNDSMYKFKPIGAFAATHYYGMSLDWPNNLTIGEEGEDFLIVENGDRLSVFVGAGTHGNFFNYRHTSYNQRPTLPNPFEVFDLNDTAVAGVYSTTTSGGSLYDGLWELYPVIPPFGDTVKGPFEGRLHNYKIKPVDKVALWRGRWGANSPIMIDQLNPACSIFGKYGPYGPLYRRDVDGINLGVNFWNNPGNLYDKYRKNRTHLYTSLHQGVTYIFPGITENINECTD